LIKLLRVFCFEPLELIGLFIMNFILGFKKD
jgi:hypothetical protein